MVMGRPLTGNPSLGVDLVELDRAKTFWRAHRSRLDSFFSGPELAYVRRARRRPHERVAVLLAAKEAAFKASGRGWMGPHGFRSILVSFPASGRSGRLVCRVDGTRARFTLTYSVRKKFVLARCAGTS
jgi:phosphopantetheinyl transferase (holo-ACP synthase)